MTAKVINLAERLRVRQAVQSVSDGELKWIADGLAEIRRRENALAAARQWLLKESENGTVDDLCIALRILTKLTARGRPLTDEERRWLERHASARPRERRRDWARLILEELEP